MAKHYLFFLLGVLTISCNGKSGQDLSLEIVGFDTTFLEGGNFKYVGTKYRMSDQNNYLLIHQGVEIYWFDVKKDSIVKSINLDTTNLILPQVSMLQAHYQETDSSLVLFFPQRNKIIHLSFDLKIEKEVNLSGIQEINHMFMPYGQVFHYDNKQRQYYIGMMSSKLGAYKPFLTETRFVGVFDGNSGKLNSSFGEFGEDRKKVESYVSSEGLINFGTLNDRFYIREKVGSSQILEYDRVGNLEKTYDIGSFYLSYKLDLNQGDFEESHSFNDHNYGMAIASASRIVSLGVKFKDDSKNILRHYGILFVEDLENGICYSTPIDPFQKILWANDSEIYLIRIHPETEDMILVKIRYKLES
ncbi:hypothetical protein [Algoriphagus sp. Y33]|uniref:hypothetical protein n=1 Tax=Algoriphagus sp. Y33 TaxID=2772483 RepID=UPI00178753B2|nr:hypothetical protein [Algoriphagus sp. Y33]